MMRKRLAAFSITALVILVGLMASVSEAAKTTIVVLDLEASGVKAHEAQILSDYVRDAIFKTGKYKLVDRKQLEAALKDLKLSMTGLSQDELIQLGKVLQAQKMVSGKLGKIGSTYTISVQLMDIQTTSIENIVNDRCSQCSVDHLFPVVTKVALRLVGTKSDSSSTPATPPPPPPPPSTPQPPSNPPPQALPDTSGMSAMEIYKLADKEKDINKRMKLYKKSIALDPNYAPVRNDLAVDLIGLGRSSEAIVELKVAVRIKPTYDLAHYNIGRAYYNQKNYVAALRAFQTAVRFNSKKARYYFRIGLSQKALSNYTDSAKAYLKCLEIDPDYIDAYYNLGYIYIDMRDKKSAIYYLQKYIQKETRPSEKKWVERARKKIQELQAQEETLHNL